MIEPMTVIQVDNESGYLVPQYIWTNGSGTRAWAMRAAGCVFRRHDWYRKGMQRHNFAEDIAEVLRRKDNLQTKLGLPK
jgi:hypothetical protein